jgi:hypothetical protein
MSKISTKTRTMSTASSGMALSAAMCEEMPSSSRNPAAQESHAKSTESCVRARKQTAGMERMSSAWKTRKMSEEWHNTGADCLESTGETNSETTSDEDSGPCRIMSAALDCEATSQLLLKSCTWRTKNSTNSSCRHSAKQCCRRNNFPCRSR